MSPPRADREKLLRKFGSSRWLTIVGSQILTPRVRRITFDQGAPDLHPQPGQNFVLLVRDDQGEIFGRHYTVADHDPSARRVVIDFVLHGDGPGANWARKALPGDRIEAFGPRGRIAPPDGLDWCFLACDETGLPAVRRILESLPSHTRGLAAIAAPDAAEITALVAPAGLQVRWRIGRRDMFEGLDTWALERPSGPGRAILVGETTAVRRLRQALLTRGLDPSQIVGEGYWRAGRFGGHDHLDR